MFKEEYFTRAFNLAEKGRGKTSPNPFAGAVIVKNNRIVGEGYTQPCGQDHAEIQALKKAGAETKDAEMYVTLEPCSHYGKTPPCTEAIIKAGIKKVFAGIQDPNPKVNGSGFKRLKEAGIKVKKGLREKDIRKQLEYYLTYITRKRPFIIMKNAVSLDGNISTISGDSKWISSKEARKDTHILRNEVDGILTGSGTVEADDPLLNVRLSASDACRHPLRFILDSNLKTSPNSKLAKSARQIKTVIFKDSAYQNPDKEKALLKHSVEIIGVSKDQNGLDLTEILPKIYDFEITSLMIEAGAKVASSFMKSGFVDKLYYYIAPKIIGGNKSVFSELKLKKLKDCFKIDIDKIEKIGDDIKIIAYLNKHYV